MQQSDYDAEAHASRVSTDVGLMPIERDGLISVEINQQPKAGESSDE